MAARLYALTLDCADAAVLAAFWAQVLDRPVDDDASHAFASIGMEQTADPGPAFIFVAVPEGKVVKNRAHPDFATADLAAEVKRLTGLGATEVASYDEGGYQWTTLQDPEGNEFDVVRAPWRS